jgi:hypothetical protein
MSAFDPKRTFTLSEAAGEVADVALEIAAGTAGKANFTLGACTGLSECPG